MRGRRLFGRFWRVCGCKEEGDVLWSRGLSLACSLSLIIWFSITLSGLLVCWFAALSLLFTGLFSTLTIHVYIHLLSLDLSNTRSLTHSSSILICFIRCFQSQYESNLGLSTSCFYILSPPSLDHRRLILNF